MSKPRLKLPPVNGSGDGQLLNCPGNVLLFGANGSGKSRLGAWIELRSGGTDFVHRISAQRALNVPDFAPLRTLEESLNDFHWGHADPRYASHEYKQGHRWGSRPETHPLNDYDKVLSALFAADSKRNKDYVETARASLAQQSTAIPPVPESELDLIHEVWRDIMPHRKIELVDGQIKAYTTLGTAYKGREMSDGEKVALYLLAQCLLVKTGSIIIIDEPELHLHKSLMSRLWTSVERLRPDCLFVFITHDLDFAATRVEATKIWVRSFDGGHCWNWGIADSLPSIPDAVLLEVLGSRKPVLFVEGDRGSLDTALLQAVYPLFHVIGRGGCQAVIQSTKAFQNPVDGVPQTVFGVIDRDFRTDAEIAALEQHNVYVLSVAEIENLICHGEVVRFLSRHLGLPADETVQKVQHQVLRWLEDELDAQVASKTCAEVKYRLTMLETTAKSEPGIAAAFNRFVSEIDVKAIWSECSRQLLSALQAQSFEECLSHYNRKSLPQRIAPLLGLQKNAYSQLVLNLLRSQWRDELLSILRGICPILNIA